MLTIRKLDEGPKTRLRIRAAGLGHAVDEDARRIPRSALHAEAAQSGPAHSGRAVSVDDAGIGVVARAHGLRQLGTGRITPSSTGVTRSILGPTSPNRLSPATCFGVRCTGPRANPALESVAAQTAL
jgi:plasmid stability protein